MSVRNRRHSSAMASIESRGLSGIHVAPDRMMPSVATIVSRWFGPSTATRFPRPSPTPASPRATTDDIRSTSPWVSTSSSRTRLARSGWRRVASAMRCEERCRLDHGTVQRRATDVVIRRPRVRPGKWAPPISAPSSSRLTRSRVRAARIGSTSPIAAHSVLDQLDRAVDHIPDEHARDARPR